MLKVKEDATEECRVKFIKIFFPVVTDNENKMIKMGEVLKSKFSNPITYSCSAQWHS